MIEKDSNIKMAEYIVKVGMVCPMCNEAGHVANQTPLAGKLIKLIKYKDGLRYEYSNRDGVCGMCGGAFRISNGSVLRRKKKWIELPSSDLGYFAILALTVPIIFNILNSSFLHFDAESLWFKAIDTSLWTGMIIFISMLFFVKIRPIVRLEKGVEGVSNFLLTDALSGEKLVRLNREQQEQLKRKDVQIRFLKPRLQQEMKQGKYGSEKELQMYIANNIESFSFDGSKLKLFENGVEYYIKGIGRIDILTKDAEGNFIVIETKLADTADKTIGQISRYMGWVDKHLNHENKDVFGVIIGHRFTEKIKYAAINKNIFLLEYDLGLMLKNIN